ncbi:MAG: cytochrome c family protein [Sphingomonas bacterium]
MKYAALIGLGAMAAPAISWATPHADPVAGATVFKKCVACHSVEPSGRNGLGPNLRGVVGHAAAKAPGFTYSPAMTAAKLVWTEQTLSRFLASPRQTVPGTRMTFAGLPDPQDRANIIAFLKQSGPKQPAPKKKGAKK